MPEATQMYWAVACRSCSEMIPLARVAFDGNSRPIAPALPEPFQFEATCARGHSGNTYSRVEVVMFQAPAALSFQPHPAFR